jgi:hypothetical protein
MAGNRGVSQALRVQGRLVADGSSSAISVLPPSESWLRHPRERGHDHLVPPQRCLRLDHDKCGDYRNEENEAL